LPTSECTCPYCSRKENHAKFFTQEQIKYARSIAVQQVVGPELEKLEQSFLNLERSTGGFLKIEVRKRGFDFPPKYYRERDLETYITCDSCGLEFAVYGVFASCPDCERLNALTILTKSIEVARKKLGLLDRLDPSESELREPILSDMLSNGVASFDGFGKALRVRYPEVFPERPKNLFQNLPALSSSLEKSIGESLSMFVVRRFWTRELIS